MNDSVECFDPFVEDAEKKLRHIVDTSLSVFPDREIILMMIPGNKYELGQTSYRKETEKCYTMFRRFARERGVLLIDHF